MTLCRVMESLGAHDMAAQQMCQSVTLANGLKDKSLRFAPAQPNGKPLFSRVRVASTKSHTCFHLHTFVFVLTCFVFFFFLGGGGGGWVVRGCCESFFFFLGGGVVVCV